MPEYKITSTVPMIHTYYVEAPDAKTALELVDTSAVEPDNVFTDYSSAEPAEVLAVDGVDV